MGNRSGASISAMTSMARSASSTKHGSVHRPVEFSGYTGDANWKDYDGCTSWAMSVWAKTGRRVLWSIAFIPKGASLAEAAKGTYNDHWKKIAEQLATWHPDEPVLYIRTGWEFNGDWFQYSSIKHPEEFVAAWKQFVSTFRSVSDRFRFDWCPSGETGHVEEAYPGDDYVDIIGLDLYDQYRWCKIKDPVERLGQGRPPR